MKKILENRQSHVDNLLSVAKKFSKQSETIESEAKSLLSKTKQDILKAENQLINELEQKNSREKQKLSKEILENTNREIASLKVSSEEAFKVASSDLDELLDLALQKMGSRKS